MPRARSPLSTSTTSGTTPPEPKRDFSKGERQALSAFGAVLAVIGLLLWLFPPTHQKPAPESAKCTDAKTCWVEVEDAPEILLSSFVVLGVLLVLIGINGRRFTKFTGPGGIGIETEGAKAAEGAANKVEESTAIPEDKKGVVSTKAAEKARRLGMERAAAKQEPLTPSDIDEIAETAVASVIVDTT